MSFDPFTLKRFLPPELVRSGGVIPPSFPWNRIETTGTAPPPTCCHTSCLYKDRYVITYGGAGKYPQDDRAHCADSVYCLDLDTHVWREVATKNVELVGPRMSHSAVIYQDKMYLYGGHPIELGTSTFMELLELDLTTWTWRVVCEAPSEPDGPGHRYLHTAVVWHDRMYVIMGDGGSDENLIYYVDLQDFTWHRVPPSPSPCAPKVTLSGHNACLDGDSVYVFGGEGRCSSVSSRGMVASVEDLSYTNMLLRYHFPTNTWSNPVSDSSQRPHVRYASAMGLLDGKLFMFGGDCSWSTRYFGDFWCFDTRSEEGCWQQISSRLTSGVPDRQRPSDRTGMSSVVARDAFYIFGGEMPPGYPARDDEERYTNEVYRVPLAITYNLPLADCAARWLSCRPPLPMAASLYKHLPLVPQQLVRSYVPHSEALLAAASVEDTQEGDQAWYPSESDDSSVSHSSSSGGSDASDGGLEEGDPERTAADLPVEEDGERSHRSKPSGGASPMDNGPRSPDSFMPDRSVRSLHENLL